MPCRTPSFRELKSRIEKPGEAESWGPIRRRRARRGSGRPKFDWQHPFSSAVRWIAPDSSDSASVSASEDLAGSLADHSEGPDVMHEGGLNDNCSLSTCSSLPASEDAHALGDCQEPERASGSSGAVPAIFEGRSNRLGASMPEGECSKARPEILYDSARPAQQQLGEAYGWGSRGNGLAGLPSSKNGHISVAASPERQVSPSEWSPGLPASRSEGLLSEWARGSFGSQSGKLFGLEASYSSEDLLAAFQTELERTPRKLARASNDSNETPGGFHGGPSVRCAACMQAFAKHVVPLWLF